MGYAVLHLVKGKGSGAGRGKHNDREVIPSNADKDRQHLNREIFVTDERKIGVCLLGERGALKDRIADRIKDGYKGKKEVRKDATTHISIVLTGSHDEMTAIEKDDEKRKQWITANFQFVAKTYGADNVVGFAVHRDEYTMHIHATVVPLTPDGRLSAKDIIGGRDGLKKLQSDYAQALSDKGFKELGRGQEGSKAKHTDVKQYYGTIKEALQGNELDKPVQVPNISNGGLKTLDLPDFNVKLNLWGNIDKEDMISQVQNLITTAKQEYQKVQVEQYTHITKQVAPIVQNVLQVAQKDRQKARVLKLEIDKTKLKERQKPVEKTKSKGHDFSPGI